jgi:hypothetical protein
MSPPKQNPLTGTLVIEPPATQAPPPRPAPAAIAAHPLERTMVIEPPAGDRTMPLVEEPPKTQAMPQQPTSLAAPFRVASPRRETPAPGTPVPWHNVRDDVAPAQDARWSTLVVEPPSAPAPKPPPAAAAPVQDEPPSIEDLLPPPDPWGAGLPAEPEPPPQPEPVAISPRETKATERVHEQKNVVRSSLYGRFKPRG